MTLLLLAVTVVPALAQGGAVPRAVDGRGLFDETLATQTMFIAVWGNNAAERWVFEHNAELARLQPGLAVPAAAAPGAVVQVPGPPPIPTPVFGAVRNPQRVSVDIRRFAYDPSPVTVSVGTTITWRNRDPMAHTVSSANFDTGELSPSGTGSVTFMVPGRISYYCMIHSNMHGDIVVQ